MRRFLLSGLVAAVMIGGAGSALADHPTAPPSTEGYDSTYACPTDGSAPNPPYDDADDCTNGAETYSVHTYDNEVDCSPHRQTAVFAPYPNELVALNVGPYGTSDGGGAEVCSDENQSTSAIQGRVMVAGSADHLTVSVDGDADNPGPTSGWVQANVDGNGPAVRCGDEAGNQDSQNPTEADDLSDCG